jgi:hypothetical protein
LWLQSPSYAEGRLHDPKKIGAKSHFHRGSIVELRRSKIGKFKHIPEDSLAADIIPFKTCPGGSE